ncbi:MAG: catalase, partial [Proteobacteria bacterium]
KLVPEELVPVQIIGKLTLNRNPDNYFAEIEQAAFHPGHVVPGIDFSNDPLLAGRLFSYTDTQITRLGGTNFHEIPVNRPLAPINNNNRDGLHRQLVPKGRVAYEPNSLAGGCPFHGKADAKTFVAFAERMEGHKVRARSQSFGDHFSQAKLFFESQTEVEKQHIKDAFTFELTKVDTGAIRERMVQTLMFVSDDLASEVAKNLGIKLPKKPVEFPSPANPDNNIVPPNRAMKAAQEDDVHLPQAKVKLPKSSTALSIQKNNPRLAESRKVAFLLTPDADPKEADAMSAVFQAAGVVVEKVIPQLFTSNRDPIEPGDEKSLTSTPSHVYDGVYFFSGKKGYDKAKDMGLAARFIGQAFKHCKTIGTNEAGRAMIKQATLGMDAGADGVVYSDAKSGAKKPGALFLEALKEHRHWAREKTGQALPY